MMKRIVSIFLVSMVHIACASALYSKGSPDKIIIKGGGLARPVEITDRETLQGFDPWSGQFIDWKKGLAADPPPQEQPFEVYFYMKWKERHSRYDQGDLKMVYSVRYLPGRDGAPGYVYLPGNDDDRYYINTGTILREGDDGKWHQASRAWDDLMKRLTTIDKP